jgi:type VI secretion system protein VasD
LLLAGCAGPPPPPPPTVVNISMTAAANANPDTDGKGAPVSLRVYQLGSQAGFVGAEFFPLYNTDAATLGTDLVKRDDFILAPGATKTTTLTPRDDVKSIGVFAAYRDFQHATWRAAADIPPHQVTNITVTAGHDGITLKAVTLPPAKPAA